MTVKRTVLQIDVDSKSVDKLAEKLKSVQKDLKVDTGKTGQVVGEAVSTQPAWYKRALGSVGIGGGRAGGAQIPFGDSSGISKIFSTIPIVGGAAMYATYKLFSDYQKTVAAAQSVARIRPYGLTKSMREGVPYGINPIQEMQMKTQYAQALGMRNDKIDKTILEAYRGYGLAPGVVGNLGSIFAPSGGAKGGLNQTNDFLKQAISTGMASGIAEGKLPQYFASIQQIMNQIAQKGISVDANSLLSLSYGLQQLTGGNRGLFGGQLGLQAVGKVSGLQQQVLQGGGDELMRIIAMRAFGFGQGKSYLQTMSEMERANPQQFFNKVYQNMSFMPNKMRAYMLKQGFGFGWNQSMGLESGLQNTKISSFNQPVPVNLSERAQAIMKNPSGNILKNVAYIEAEKTNIGYKASDAINSLNLSLLTAEKTLQTGLIPPLKGISVLLGGIASLMNKAMWLLGGNNKSDTTERTIIDSGSTR